MRKRIVGFTLVAGLAATPAAAAGSGDFGVSAAALDALGRSPVGCTTYDGRSDDLLTAGLGRTGLQGPAPGFADALNPTAAELRRLAIYTNYRALVDVTPGGGFGRLYGPNVRADGTVTDEEGTVAGTECITNVVFGPGGRNVTTMVQIPAAFRADAACLVTGPSSGSRGVYGAIGTSGEWGLKNGCAVAYTDKGTGTGAHDLQDDTVNRVDGVRADADAAGTAANFRAPIDEATRTALVARTPERFAFEHAHSRQNPEATWDDDVLLSIAFAFLKLNRIVPGGGIRPENTIVIASSVSNGGGASLRAAEIAPPGLIDGVAVSEPNVAPPSGAPFAIVQGDRAPYLRGGKHLFDYVSRINVFQGCANLAQPDAPLNGLPAALGESRCAALRAAGLLSADGVDAQAAQAQRIINRYGILPEQNILQPSHWTLSVPQAVAATYADAYARAGVEDALCDYSFAATDAAGTPTALAPAAEAILFATSSGIPPTGGVNLVDDASLGGARANTFAISPTGAADQNLDGALCLRGLWTGREAVTDAPLTGARLEAHRRLRQGVRETLATADLGGTPAIVVHGRADPVVHPNHASRAYAVVNRQVEGDASRLRYVEVTNAQHLDALNGLPGFDTRFVPLHVYFLRALDQMYAHLTTGSPLPPSQVVRTVPRGGTPGAAPPIEAANLPPIEATPAADARIAVDADRLTVPE